MKYSKIIMVSVLITTINIIHINGSSQESNKPIIWFPFEELSVDEGSHIRIIKEQISGEWDTIQGTYATIKRGVHGNSLLLDGYSAHMQILNAPALKGGFSVESWIALGAYPTNYCPVAEQGTAENKGFSLGVNHLGIPFFKIATKTGWIHIEGNVKIPLHSWVHICGVYNEKNIALYFNGKLLVKKEISTSFVTAGEEVLYCGRTVQKTVPAGVLHLKGTQPVYHYFDGLIDELKIWGKALGEKDMGNIKKELPKIKTPDLQKRILPQLPESNHFGAVYANLEFYESWDYNWRMTGLPDIVVSFDKIDGNFVFWRGTSYIPHWVVGNKIWYTDEFNETWSNKGCHEPMSDKRCEHSQVKIVENSPARCVVHWRYALIDNWYKKSNVDPITGWGDWTDEVYTIYPDGVAVRSQTLHSRNLSSSFEWHEGIITMGQGQRPEDVLFPKALIMSNIEGDEHIYSWEAVDSAMHKDGITYVINKKEKWLTELQGANIQLINTRSLYKPFTIINPEDEPQWDYFSFFFRRDVSIFPWWNHWPTSFKPSDGRYAFFPDRASHTSIAHVKEWKSYKKTEYSETKLMLVGLTKENASDLVPLTKSWSNPPKMSVRGLETTDLGYDPSDKGYHIKCQETGSIKGFIITLDCSGENPAVNPAFIVSNWNKEEFSVNIDGKKLSDGNQFRHGFVNTSSGRNLILWIDQKFDHPVDIEITMKE